MKISKSLLQAILVGVTIGAASTSCESIKKETANIHLKSCAPNCDIDHGAGDRNNNGGFNPGNCPACGMG